VKQLLIIGQGALDVSKICDILYMSQQKDPKDPKAGMFFYVRIDLDSGMNVPVICQSKEAMIFTFEKLLGFWQNPPDGITRVEDLLGGHEIVLGSCDPPIPANITEPEPTEMEG
jgi:hypothetical protein